jgi:DNA-directed RNA polymerase alpha subunit
MSARNQAPGVRDLDGLFLKTLHYHALANYGLLTKTAIAELSERELLRIPRVGLAAIASINRELARHGLMLRGESVGFPARSGRRLASARFGGGA